MTREGTKEAAEAVLRELPSVIGACVREDVYGHPREVHLLVRAGPNPRHLAYDVRDLLEERLGVPIDQRVISIAQLAPGRGPVPLLAGRRLAAAGTAPACRRRRRGAGAAVETEPRVRFLGISTEVMDSRVRVRVRLELDDEAQLSARRSVWTRAGRLRAVAAAALSAVDTTCVGARASRSNTPPSVDAFERDYVLVSVLASSPYLGRRPIPLVGAQPVEMDAESAAALAALKASTGRCPWCSVCRTADGSRVRRQGATADTAAPYDAGTAAQRRTRRRRPSSSAHARRPATPPSPARGSGRARSPPHPRPSSCARKNRSNSRSADVLRHAQTVVAHAHDELLAVSAPGASSASTSRPPLRRRWSEYLMAVGQVVRQAQLHRGRVDLHGSGRSSATCAAGPAAPSPARAAGGTPPDHFAQHGCCAAPPLAVDAREHDRFSSTFWISCAFSATIAAKRAAPRRRATPPAAAGRRPAWRRRGSSARA
jgi:hypothetical protein